MLPAWVSACYVTAYIGRIFLKFGTGGFYKNFQGGNKFGYNLKKVWIIYMKVCICFYCRWRLSVLIKALPSSEMVAGYISVAGDV
jgi:hypothetical protein